jgi:hypothetical protein
LSPTVRIKGLSLTQPWATLVAIGAKQIETRSWGTNYRGLVAIHAAKGFPPDARDYCDHDLFSRALRHHGYDSWKALPTGVIVAVAELYDCCVFSSKGTDGGPWHIMTPDANGPHGYRDFVVGDDEYAFGDYALGRYGWFLRNIVRLPEPVPVKGALGLWTLPPDVLTLVKEAARV